MSDDFKLMMVRKGFFLSHHASQQHFNNATTFNRVIQFADDTRKQRAVSISVIAAVTMTSPTKRRSKVALTRSEPKNKTEQFACRFEG